MIGKCRPHLPLHTGLTPTLEDGRRAHVRDSVDLEASRDSAHGSLSAVAKDDERIELSQNSVGRHPRTDFEA